MCLPARPVTPLIMANRLEMDVTVTNTFSVLLTDSAGEPAVWLRLPVGATSPF